MRKEELGWELRLGHNRSLSHRTAGEGRNVCCLAAARVELTCDSSRAMLEAFGARLVRQTDVVVRSAWATYVRTLSRNRQAVSYRRLCKINGIVYSSKGSLSLRLCSAPQALPGTPAPVAHCEWTEED